MENSNNNAYQLRVKRSEPTLVSPAEETENGFYLLSNRDQNMAVIIRTIYGFKSDKRGNDKARGRRDQERLGETGEGAVFVEAEADCKMEEIGDVTRPGYSWKAGLWSL
ncbi:hypothetical protein TIFTF001_026543 [Ficus carica]|uniref:Uncharacterized protein n=1 Tax=Ficus carica TaxID=3494 RepID=A0AA88DLG9_FICCA|nr:hypothetical protein TIFTF001_026543 [Ficus carica]